ncbi:MFS transporter [Novosphingobium bradum]|uniref:MFS transporter n=1 Tax=Novosphingobium bradum TaxID=1737444 RepID=A0ABV7ISN3_9SPHN
MADGSELPDGNAAAAPSVRRGALAPFRYRAFREVWLGNTASQLGSQMQSIGAAWLMTELTTSHAMVAAVPASGAFAVLLLSVPAGAVADNFDRRKIMLAAQSAMLVVSAILAVLTWAGKIGAFGLLAFTMMVGCGMAFSLPSWTASVRALAEPPVMPQAIALNSVSFNLGRSVGPALGGLVLAAGGVATAFALNALSYVALILALSRWRPNLPAPRREPLLRSIRAGLAFCRTSVPVRRVLIRGAAFSFSATAIQGLLPVILRGRLGGNETQFGVLLGAFGVGSVLGAVLSPPVRRRFGSEWAMMLGAAGSTIGLLGLALAPSVPMLLACQFAGGIGWTGCLTTFNVAMQLRVPAEILGRCMAIYQAVTIGSLAVGAWTWGLLADATSATAAVFVATVTLVAGTLVLRALSPLPARGEGVVLDRG